MADAYLHASEGQHSPEIEKLHRIDRFGVEAVTGRRELLYRDYLHMITADNINRAYQSREAATNWAQWAAENPRAAKLLNEAELLCQT